MKRGRYYKGKGGNYQNETWHKLERIGKRVKIKVALTRDKRGSHEKGIVENIRTKTALIRKDMDAC